MTQIGKITFNKFSVKSALEEVCNIIQNAERCHQVVVANSFSLVTAHKDAGFAEICKSADIVFADGLPVVWASKILGYRIPERITGPDFMWTFSEVCAQKSYKVFLLGSEEPHLTQLKINLEMNFPSINIVGTYAPPFGDWSDEENQKIISMIDITKVDIVWVGVSTPKQDKWISKYKGEIKAKIAYWGHGRNFQSNKKSVGNIYKT